jgi:ribosomal-protein-alanine N-acetyltransferase
MIAAVLPRHLIRSMAPSDVQAVAAVERRSYQFPWGAGIFRDCLLAGYQCLVLEAEDGIVGYGIMSIAAAEAHLLNLCIRPEDQNKGHGRRLLEALLSRAREANVEKVFLEVRPSNGIAIELYRSVGFERIGIRPSYYQAEHGREDAVILAANLHSST